MDRNREPMQSTTALSTNSCQVVLVLLSTFPSRLSMSEIKLSNQPLEMKAYHEQTVRRYMRLKAEKSPAAGYTEEIEGEKKTVGDE